MIIDTIEEFLDRFATAWIAGDAGAFAGLFIEDATFVTCQGRWLRGREEIARGYEASSGGRLRFRPVNIRALGPAVRLVVTEGGGETQTFTLILRDRRWVCAAFHNSAARGQAAAE
jgi:uncharacterized protein (TIGR02246 family)